MITHERLLELVLYDPETGHFVSKNRRGPRPAGTRLGTLRQDGYRFVCVDYKQYLGHRLAWFYMTGAWPVEQVDHINQNRDDNRFSNLRQATNSQNHQNKKSSNLSGLKGITRSTNPYAKPWLARIKLENKTIYLGTFDEKEDAHAAYCAAAKRLFGEFHCLETKS